MLSKRKKKRLDDEIGPSKGLMKWVNKFFRLILFPFIHPVAFVCAIVFAALVILVVPAYFGIEFRDTFDWYRQQFDHSYHQAKKAVVKEKVVEFADKAQDTLKELTGNGADVKAVKKKSDKQELVEYNVAPKVNRKLFQRPAPQEDIVAEKWVGEVEFKRVDGLGLVYAEQPQKLSGKVRVVNANELRVNGQLVFLYGIYSEPNSEKGQKAEAYLRDHFEGKEADCFIGAYAKDGTGTVICLSQGKNINQTLVDLDLSRNVGLN